MTSDMLLLKSILSFWSKLLHGERHHRSCSRRKSAIKVAKLPKMCQSTFFRKPWTPKPRTQEQTPYSIPTLEELQNATPIKDVQIIPEIPPDSQITVSVPWQPSPGKLSHHCLCRYAVSRTARRRYHRNTGTK